MDIIYCAGGNKRLASIAIKEGFLYGSRSDDIRNVRCDGLIDINWKKYDWEKHVFQVSTNKPKYAVVPDILKQEDLYKSIDYGYELQQYCTRVIIVPKIGGVIKTIPSSMVIGISVPTTYAGFLPNVTELYGREVHFLGGTPGQQRELWKYYTRMEDLRIHVVSLDCNSHSKASDYGSYWNGYKWCHDITSSTGKYECFKLSCQGIMQMWSQLGAR